MISRLGQTYDISRNQLTSLDLALLAISDNNRLHGNITLERGDDIGSLLFLVPTNNSVQQKNSNDNTEIDPITKTEKVSVGSLTEN